jgi:thiol-disulfide isomerase/thioredoxin
MTSRRLERPVPLPLDPEQDYTVKHHILAVSMLSFLGYSPLALAQSPAPAKTQAVANPSPASFTVGDPGRQFNSESARSQFLAIHFLLPTDCPYCIREIREYVESAPTLAGVRHIYVNAHTPEGFAEWIKTVPNATTLPIYRDQDAQLSKKFNIPGDYQFHNAVMTYPALVLLDPQGREVFRHVGKKNTDRLPFATLAAKVAELTRDKETASSNVTDSIALQGYDPVAYLDENKAMPGSKDISSSFRALTYRFASAASRDKFNAEPTKYLPAYGGWCATAMAKGDKVEIDPKNFKVTNGRLFLFYKSLFGNALNDWNKDEPGLTAKADTNWKKVAMEK